MRIIQERILSIPLQVILLLAFFLLSCEKRDTLPEQSKQSLTILYTNDEHGWMEPYNELFGGASALSGRWKEIEALEQGDNFIILSGGDMWTGPAISSWFQGESMVGIMNGLGYDAGALGNHEFDFSVEVLRNNVLKMDFPIISANIIEKETGEKPSFVQPYLLKKFGDLDVGVIGLSSLSTPYTAFPAYVERFQFTEYAAAIEQYAPELRHKGAEIILIIGHICEDEMIELIPLAKKYNISFIGGGHCHQIISSVIDGIALIQAGSFLAGYGRIVLDYYPKTGETVVVSNNFIINEDGFSDPGIEATLGYWRELASEALQENIGYCAETINQNSTAMGNMVVDSWLYSFPASDVSITNAGGIRQNIPGGNITVETVVGLLPFTNTIYALELSGEELIDCINGYLIGGMSTINGYTLSNGTPVYDDSMYSVLTTDYLYSLSSNNMSTYDPEPYETAVNYRQPLIDWLRSIETNEQNPLENYLDNIPRR